jgi:hypothetical protein
MRVENAGAVPVRLVADARFLTLDVLPSGAKKAMHCSLPADMRPESHDERALVVPPGRAYVESFDPRAYCFSKGEAAALAPGATVTAHLGWPSAGRGHASAPFIVEPLAGLAPAVGPLKELTTAPWTIAAVAAATSAPSLPDADAPAAEDGALPLSISSSPESDAGSANDVSMTISVHNVIARPVELLVRPETISVDIRRPDGTIARCGGMRTVDSPIRELYETIAPKGHSSIQLLLRQFCPPKTFEQAGVYEATASLDTRRASGRGVGLVTFDGFVPGKAPTRIRLRRTRMSTRMTRPTLE